MIYSLETPDAVHDVNGLTFVLERIYQLFQSLVMYQALGHWLFVQQGALADDLCIAFQFLK
jgi:hypothetical protein